jgi:hypothetical protein
VSNDNVVQLTQRGIFRINSPKPCVVARAISWRRLSRSKQPSYSPGMRRSSPMTDGPVSSVMAMSAREVREQRCRLHKTANVLAKLRLPHSNPSWSYKGIVCARPAALIYRIFSLPAIHCAPPIGQPAANRSVCEGQLFRYDCSREDGRTPMRQVPHCGVMRMGIDHRALR